MNLIFIFIINLLALFLAPTIGTLLSIPINIIVLSLTIPFKEKCRPLFILTFFLEGLFCGGLTILGVYYFLNLFGLYLTWTLVILIAFAFLYNDWGRYIKPLLFTSDRIQLWTQVADDVGIFLAIFIVAVYLL